VAAGVVVGVLTAWLVTMLTPPKYSAEATLFVSAQPGTGDSASALEANELLVARMATYAEILESDRLARQVAQALDLTPPDVLVGQISATVVPTTTLIRASVTYPDAEGAADVANGVGAQFLENVEELEQPINPTDPPLIAAEVYEEAMPPTAPISPRPLFNLVLGLLAGLLLGIGAAIARHAVKAPVAFPQQIQRLVGGSPGACPTCNGLGVVLGVIGRSRKIARHPLAMRNDPDGTYAEGIRRLRTNLRFVAPGRPSRVVLLVGVAPTEGRTTALCNVAIAIADTGRKVLLIDADLRRPRVTDLLGLHSASGLSGLLVSPAPLQSAIQRWNGVIDVLPSGPVPHNPAELLASDNMAQLLDEVRRQYDVVLVDASPLAVSDGLALSSGVDGVVLAVRHGKTSVRQVETAHESLATVSARLLGVLVTDVPKSQVKRYLDVVAVPAGRARSRDTGAPPMQGPAATRAATNETADRSAVNGALSPASAPTVPVLTARVPVPANLVQPTTPLPPVPAPSVPAPSVSAPKPTRDADGTAPPPAPVPQAAVPVTDEPESPTPDAAETAPAVPADGHESETTGSDREPDRQPGPEPDSEPGPDSPRSRSVHPR